MSVYDIKVGYSCNNKCMHCVIADCATELRTKGDKIDLSLAEIEELLHSAHSAGADCVVLTGGEVTIRTDFPAILDLCSKFNFRIVVQTNGRKLIKREIADAIGSYKDISLVIALHGAQPETHDKITQISGSFAETMAGIKAMQKFGKKISAKVVLSKINMNELPELVRTCAAHKINDIYIAYPHGQGAARVNYSTIAPRYSALKKILARTGDLADQLNIPLYFEAIPFCVVPTHLKKVGELEHMNGEESYFVPVAEKTQNWEKIRKETKSKFKGCSTCLFNYICEGVWEEYVNFFGNDDLQPIPGTKEQQQKMTRILKYDLSMKKTD